MLNDELVEIIKTNVRFPDLAMGDFRAQIAAVKTGERRFLQLLQRYGRDAVLGSIQQIYRHSGEVARQAVLAIPDGVYEAESFMDDDGVRLGQRIPIRVQGDRGRRRDDHRPDRRQPPGAGLLQLRARRPGARRRRSLSSA